MAGLEWIHLFNVEKKAQNCGQDNEYSESIKV